MELDDVTESLVGIIPPVVAAGATLTVADQAFKNRALEGKRVSKVSKKRAGYKEKSSVKGQTCSNCEFYIPEDRYCEVVAGDIDPKGWSKFWTKEK